MNASRNERRPRAGMGPTLCALSLLLACVPPATAPLPPAGEEPAPEAEAPAEPSAPEQVSREGVETFQETTSTLRGLQFREPVQVKWIVSEEIPEIVRVEVEETFEPGYVVDYRDAYATLGLLPPDIDLLETVLDLQAEQLVGLYSLSRRTLYVVVGGPATYEAPTILIHELVHALQHQHFPQTVTLLQRLEHNDDLASALGAAVEGDASLIMLAASDDLEGERAMEAARYFSRAMLLDLENPMGLLAEVPRILQVSLIAPYAYGVILAAERFATAGTAGLDDLIADPPISTLQLFYPGAEPEVEFIRLPLEWLDSELEEEQCWTGHHNVAGVLTLRVLLEEFAPALVQSTWLSQWRGDRFLHVRCPDGPRLLWLLRWGTPEAARSFARAYRTFAAAAADRAELDAAPEAVVLDRTTVVVSPDLVRLVPELTQRVDSRLYASLSRWMGEGCFPDRSCLRAEREGGTYLMTRPTPP
jgi:hypothetical protein